MNRKLLDLCYIAMGAALMAVCAWITIPFGFVPFTMQTFAVFAVAAVFGWKRGMLSLLVYVALGALGAPVFAGFRSGPGVLLGFTGGYIVGFFFTALLVGGAAERFHGKTLPLAVGIFLGMVAYYAFGSIWYLVVYTHKTGAIGLASILLQCVVPYLLPDAAKGALAVLVAKRLRKVVK